MKNSNWNDLGNGLKATIRIPGCVSLTSTEPRRELNLDRDAIRNLATMVGLRVVTGIEEAALTLAKDQAKAALLAATATSKALALWLEETFDPCCCGACPGWHDSNRLDTMLGA